MTYYLDKSGYSGKATKIGIQAITDCALCAQSYETFDHLFIE